ncbi:hypothetical protein [Phenylobacterium sp.]|jgi:hypothetical protein|uniref:hypothetical protein n=1 Tax=Phenylobacterium sp. TaxID=1871053 RepID=UPI002E2FF666|nr:hypothetical protein [Phenylobacterium sp.]HEX3366621.1 hypothetical protein [Phenylobacterium sp.]
MKTTLIALALALALPAGAASAQPLDLRLPDPAAPAVALPIPAQAAKPMPDIANPLDPLARPALQSKTLDTAVFAKTAVETKLAGRSDLTGGLGFMCGLQPGHTESGGAAAYGSDPHGRFVGAKFSLAF